MKSNDFAHYASPSRDSCKPKSAGIHRGHASDLTGYELEYPTTEGFNPWEVGVAVELPDLGRVAVRNVLPDDQDNLRRFGKGLSRTSRNLFSPYPWGCEEDALRAFSIAIERNRARVDATYLALLDEIPIGHFVLWGMGSLQHFREFRLSIPTLGIAVIDEWHGRGIGTICLRLAQAVCLRNNTDAIELTTAHHNAGAGRLYQRLGFIDCGTLHIPLGIDPSTPIDECKGVTRWREERHMYYPVKLETERHVAAFLNNKEYSYRNVRACQ